MQNKEVETEPLQIRIEKRKISISSSSSSDSSDSEEEQNASTFQNINFPTIVNIFSEIKKSNYLPFLKLLKRSKIDKSIDIYKKDENGFNAFHYLIRSGNFHLVKSISHYFPKFLENLTNTNQSNLIIALNQSTFDLVNFFLNQEKNFLEHEDDFGFNVFFYLVKNNSIAMFFYILDFYLKKIERDQEKNNLNDHMISKILYQKSPLNLKQKSKIGSTLIHWAAFKDSEFFMKIFFRFNSNFNIKDNTNFTPFERASENNSFKVIVFLDEYSHYPFQTNYFLYNTFKPIEFDFLPDNLEKIEKNYESPNLVESFKFKKKKEFNLLKSLSYFYRKYNLKYKFGLLLYTLWTILTIIFIMPHIYKTELEIIYQIIYYIFKIITFIYTIKFYHTNDIYNLLKKKKKNIINYFFIFFLIFI